MALCYIWAGLLLECFKSTITDRWVFVLVFSLLPPVWVMIWTFSLAFVPILHQFYSLISSFSPPNHAGNLSEISFLSVWKKTCGAFIKTRIIHQVSEPSGPVSSICWTESTPPPTYWCTKLTQRDAILTAPKSFPAFYHKAGKTCRLWSQRWLIAPWYRGHYMFPGSESQRCSSSQ